MTNELMSRPKSIPLQARQFCRTVLLTVSMLAAYPLAVATTTTAAETDDVGSVWGNIAYYTDTYVVVSGKQYNFDQRVIIDTYSQQSDKRGNVRLRLDSYGTVIQVFFFGIDMPEVITRYKR